MTQVQQIYGSIVPNV